MKKTAAILIKTSVWSGLLALCIGTLIISSCVLYLMPKLPKANVLKDIKLQIPLRIYTADAKLISEFGEKRRQPIQFKDISPLFIKAILAAEDHRFYQHHGVDVTGLARAVIELITTGEKKSGGSTITMQVARNFFLTRKQTYIRKFNEILLALQIEQTLTKAEILELYLNKIYLGHRAYGIAAASQVYYGKHISALTLAELAMIAGLPKAPSRYNPIANPERAKIRRNWIITRMQLLNFIDKKTAIKALNAPITARPHGLRPQVSAPYLAEMVRKKMVERYGQSAYEDGYTIITTLSSKLQTQAQLAVEAGLQAYTKRHGYHGAEGKISFQVEHRTPENTEHNGRLPLDVALNALKRYYSIGSLKPAIVLDTQSEYALAVLKDSQIVKIPLAEMAWARKHINPNRLGPKIQTSNDVLTIGDMIRVQLQPIKQTKEPSNNLIDWPIAALAQISKVQAALVSLSPTDGSIKALVGGNDFRLSKFNRVIQAGRQAGSAIKPLIYSAALYHGYTAASIINDAPLVFQDKSLESVWRPENSGGRFLGPTRLRQALYQSRNLVSIRLLRELGVSKAIDFINRFDLKIEKLPKDLSLALGSASLTPLQVAKAYAAFANGGYKIEPYFIKEIRDTNQNIIEAHRPYRVCRTCEPKQLKTFDIRAANPISGWHTEETPSTAINTNQDQTDNPEFYPAERIIDARVCYIMRSMLQDVIKYGTGRKAKVLGRHDIGGKTGTTNDQKDAWFSGFNDNLVTTVWVGYDNPKTLGSREFGGTVALPVWVEYMREALRNVEEKPLDPPPGLVTVRIDPDSGQRARPGQANAIFEIFRDEYLPPYALANTNSPTTGTDDTSTTNLEDIF